MHELSEKEQFAKPWFQTYDIAMLVGEDLDFYVTWVINELLDQHSVITKCRLSLGLG